MDEPTERRLHEAVRRHARAGLLPPAALHVGLGAAEHATLLTALGWPALAPARTPAATTADPPSPSPPHLPALVALLWSRRAGDGPATRLMAGTVASAAFGARHLWQDLGATGRPEVTALLQRHFPSVVETNLRDLKWKHHLFVLLGEAIGEPGLRPPRCDGCEDQPRCFPSPPGSRPLTLDRSSEGRSP